MSSEVEPWLLVRQPVVTPAQTPSERKAFPFTPCWKKVVAHVGRATVASTQAELNKVVDVPGVPVTTAASACTFRVTWPDGRESPRVVEATTTTAFSTFEYCAPAMIQTSEPFGTVAARVPDSVPVPVPDLIESVTVVGWLTGAGLP